VPIGRMSGAAHSIEMSLSVGPAAPSEKNHMTILDFVETPVTNRFGITLVQLHDELWRVTRKSGEVLGYIDSFTERGGRRFRAKRMFSAQRPSLPLGEFWSIDDAVDCFRFS
jgi:hypothetical protein